MVLVVLYGKENTMQQNNIITTQPQEFYVTEKGKQYLVTAQPVKGAKKTLNEILADLILDEMIRNGSTSSAESNK